MKIQEYRKKTHPPNIFSGIPGNLPEELFEDILTTASFRVERIVSDGHSSPEGFWYDQEMNEWVILLKGEASLLFENRDGAVTLRPGDYIHIPAHVRHRVEKTGSGTVWLAIHYA